MVALQRDAMNRMRRRRADEAELASGTAGVADSKEKAKKQMDSAYCF